MDQAHEFAHQVAVKPGRPEGVLGHQPAWRKDHEIAVGGAWRVAGRGQHGEDRRVGVVDADRAQRHEMRGVVLDRGEVAVPGDDVEWGARLAALPELAAEALDHVPFARRIVKPSHRRQEIPGMGQAVAADRPEFWQAERCTVVLGDIAARRAVGQRDGKRQAARQQRDLARRDLQAAEFGADLEPTLLRHQQHLGVGIDQRAPVHRGVGGVDQHAQPGLGLDIAVGHDAGQAIDEVDRCAAWDGPRHGEGRPAQRVGRNRHAAGSAAGPQRLFASLVAPGHHRGLAPVEPAAPVLSPRRGEGAARDLLCVQAMGDALRAVAALRQRAGNSLGGELVAEPAEVVQGLVHEGVSVEPAARP